MRGVNDVLQLEKLVHERDLKFPLRSFNWSITHWINTGNQPLLVFCFKKEDRNNRIEMPKVFWRRDDNPFIAINPSCPFFEFVLRKIKEGKKCNDLDDVFAYIHYVLKEVEDNSPPAQYIVAAIRADGNGRIWYSDGIERFPFVAKQLGPFLRHNGFFVPDKYLASEGIGKGWHGAHEDHSVAARKGHAVKQRLRAQGRQI